MYWIRVGSHATERNGVMTIFVTNDIMIRRRNKKECENMSDRKIILRIAESLLLS